MAQPELVQLLQHLSEQSAALLQTDSLEDYQNQAKDVCRRCTLTLQQLAGVRRQLQCLDSTFWEALADEGIAMADATKTLNAFMRYGSVLQACAAAALYSWLLRAPNAPVHNMLDTLTFSGCLQRIKETVFASSSSSKSSKSAKASQQQTQSTQADDDFGDEEAGPSQARPSQSTAGAAADLEAALCLCYEALTNLAAMARGVQLRNSQEVLQVGLEGCCDLLCCSKTAKAPSGWKGLGLAAGSISAAAYDVLKELFHSRHGCMQDIAAAVLPRLTPLMVGAVLQQGKRTASEVAASRAAAVMFVRDVYRTNPEIQDAIAALARHICLKAPDKADCRAAAVKAVTELVTDLPQWEQEQFAGFVFNLSRSTKLGLRTLSVGLANSLLMNLPEPFKRSTFATAEAQAAADADAEQAAAAAATAATTSSGGIVATPAPTRTAGHRLAAAPAGMVVAPWSVVALAALLHRCSDKSAVVRGRALSDLAEVVDCFASLLAEDPASEQHQVAEAFLEGLAAAAALQVKEPRSAAAAAQQRNKKRAGKAKDCSDDEDDEGDDSAQADGELDADGNAAAAGDDEQMPDGVDEVEQQQQQQQTQTQRCRRKPSAVFVAYMPSQLSADLNPITSLVHRRCGDPKAAVRRGALQLLEALLIMRASWQGYPRQLPGSADLALLEAATSDPLVSVRKAALVVLSTLLEFFPGEPSLCQAWVASGLPLVRDVEASIQESVADWAAALLFEKAAAAGAALNKKARKAAATAATAAADDEMDWQADEREDAAAAAGEHDGSVAAAGAFLELRQLLSSVAAVGRAAGACLGKLCAGMAVKKKLKAGPVARGLEAVIAGTPTGSPAALGAYILLKEIASLEPKAPSWHFLQERWAAVRAAAAAVNPGSTSATQAADACATQAQDAERDTQQAASQAGSASVGLADEAAALLLVISETAAGFPPAQAQVLAAELLQHTLSFQLPPAAAGAHVAALFNLTEAAAGDASAGSSGAAAANGTAGPPAHWAKEVFTAAHERLRKYIDVSSAGSAANAQLDHTTCVAMFTVGEVCLLKAAKPPSGLIILLQALTAHKFIPSSTMGLSQAYTQSQLTSQAGGVGLIGSQAGPDSSQATWGPVAASLADSTQADVDANGTRLVPACVQAHAWIALGKVCMVDESLAKKCVPLFVQELGRSSLPVVRNNNMVALSDMLIQYTALVDAHMPRLAACIRDRHELVRRQALALLANLLMKDYVKWRGPLFHRFALALVDPSPAVRQLAEYLLRDVIAVKAPLLAYNHFVEALFVLNGCTAGLHGARLGANLAGGPAAAAAGATPAWRSAAAEAGDGAADDEEELSEAWMAAPAQFTLKGKQNRAARDVVYAALLKSMSAEHKFSSAAKLCGEVLAGVADGLLPLTECEEVLRDALCLLASKDIKVSASRLAAQDDEGELQATQPGAPAGTGGSATAAEAAARARGKLVSALMKRHLVEQVVPVLVELRRLLAEVRHPLLVELMGAFAALLKEYKGEVEDILVADKQLAKEILYDIKQAEQAKQLQQQHHHHQQQQAAATGPASAAGTSAAGATATGARRSPPPTGVIPGTPVAAEVLATAERQRREQLQQLRQQQQGGEMPAPSPRPPLAQRTPGLPGSSTAAAAAVMRTPASGAAGKSRLASSSSSAGPQQLPGTTGRIAAAAGPGTFQTPAAKTPGTASRAATGTAGGVGGTGASLKHVVASPAPLTVPKRRARAAKGTKTAAAGDENKAPNGTGCALPTVSQSAAELLQRSSPSDHPTNVLLPSPFKPTPKRQWNIPQHVATGEKQQKQQQATQQQEAVQKERGSRAASKAAATAGADADGAAAAAGRAGRASGRSSRRHTQQPAAAAEQQAAAGSGDSAAGSGGRRDTRAQKDAAAALKVEQAAAAELEAGGRRAVGTRKRRNA